LINSDQECSLYYINLGVPVFVQAKAIRALGGGQVDYCFVKGKTLNVIESKSSHRLSSAQRYRLINSSTILSDIFDFNATLTLFVKGEIFRIL